MTNINNYIAGSFFTVCYDVVIPVEGYLCNALCPPVSSVCLSVCLSCLDLYSKMEGNWKLIFGVADPTDGVNLC